MKLRCLFIATLAAFIPSAASALTVTVDSPGISNPNIALGNVVLISSNAEVRVSASTGAVTFPSGTALRIKTSGASPANAPSQTVTVSCSTGGAGGNCSGKTFRVLVSQVSVSGRASSLTRVNASNMSATSGSLSFSSSTPEAAPSATTALFTVTSSSNTFSFTFRVGATAALTSGAGSSAGWTYRVQVMQ